MKVEVELFELTELRNAITNLENDNHLLRDKLKSLDEDSLSKKTKEDAVRLFTIYLNKTFEQLGFEYNPSYSVRSLYVADDDWGNVKINLGAELTKEWRKAFLDINIILNKNENN